MLLVTKPIVCNKGQIYVKFNEITAILLTKEPLKLDKNKLWTSCGDPLTSQLTKLIDF